ncbi:MAG TPA: DUF6049 family protein [Acidimicrobiia bacterium]|nr:DUF6049 family protein [Acidimicrobiia bacterium]
MRRAAPLGALVAALSLLLSLAVLPDASGADTPPPTGAAAPSAAPTLKPHLLTLASQTPWAAPDSDVHLGLALDGPADGLTVTVLVHRAVTSRTALGQNLEGRNLGGLEGRIEVTASDLVAGETGVRDLRLGVQGPASAAAATPDAARIVPGRSGVYPTEVLLYRHGSVIDRFVTPLVVIAAGLSPLTVAWVWRFDDTPAHQPDGTVRKAAARDLSAGGRLVALAQAAAAAGDVHLTLAPGPETLEAWDEVAHQEDHLPGGPPPGGATAGLTALRTAAGTPGHQVLSGPFVGIDIPGLLDANLGGEVDAEFAKGTAAVADVLKSAPAPAALLAPQPLNNAGLARLRQYGTQRIVLPPDGLQPRDQRLTPGHPFQVGGRGQPVAAAVSDPDLAALLDGADAPALRAARFLAGLSLVALEAPGEPRGVVVVSPDDWDPPAALLEAVLAGLRNNPSIVPATVDEYFAAVAPEQVNGRPLVRDLAGRAPTDPSDADALRSLRRKLAAFGGVVESNPAWIDAADRSILISRATVLDTDDRGERKLSSPTAYLQGADKLIKSVTSKVHGPKGQRVTLTSRRATIPISLLNDTGRPLQVKIRLESDQLRFLDGAERTLTLAPQNTTEQFRVESRSTGAFPLDITVTSPDGALIVNTSELTIRSTVVSGVGAVLTAGAGLFLLIWWGNDLRRSRRRRSGRARRQGRIAARAAARALDDAERVGAYGGH